MRFNLREQWEEGRANAEFGLDFYRKFVTLWMKSVDYAVFAEIMAVA